MSIRTLIEINHDHTHDLDQRFLEVLAAYLRSGDKSKHADDLERYGIRVISSRHHSTMYHIPANTVGFITKYPEKR